MIVDLRKSESYSPKLNNVVELRFVPVFPELGQRQPYLSVRVFEVFLIDLMRMVNPELVVFVVD